LVDIPESGNGGKGAVLRRLFSTFAPGAPGAGLLLLRVAAGGALFAHAVSAAPAGFTLGTLAKAVLGIAGGILLLAGLWTPVAGSLVAVLGVSSSILQAGNLWANILLGSIGAALALLGPGAWSMDARLFGWRRIDFHEREP
jgi:hypothetical protein